MLDKNGVFDVVFSDTDRERVKQLESRLKELEYETVIYSEVFRNGCWENEINVSLDMDAVRTTHLLFEQ